MLVGNSSYFDTDVQITTNGKARPLRVFWDMKCLKTGEEWEKGFIKAICSSALVVPVHTHTLSLSVWLH